MSVALAAADELATQGISVRLLDMHTIKPIDQDAVVAAIEETGAIVTVEDHNIMNGLGSAVCEIVAEHGGAKVRRIGIQDRFGESAPYERLLEKNEITKEAIAEACRALMEDKNR